MMNAGRKREKPAAYLSLRNAKQTKLESGGRGTSGVSCPQCRFIQMGDPRASRTERDCDGSQNQEFTYQKLDKGKKKDSFRGDKGKGAAMKLWRRIHRRASKARFARARKKETEGAGMFHD